MMCLDAVRRTHHQQDDQTKADPQFEPCNPNAVHVVVVLKECRVHLLKLA